MVKVLRWVISALVLAYTVWISWPVIEAKVLGQPDEPFVSSRAADDIDYRGGYSMPQIRDPYAEPFAESIQGRTALEAIETDNKPVIWLWASVVALYVIAAFLFANGNLRAAFAYGLGFIADVILTYLTKGEAGSGIYDKILEILSGWDPRYVLTLIALGLGFLMAMARMRPANRRPF
ncbi:MAG: hypothetical protein B7Z26_11215 [Asticcacaulis sp. 32-58-5]|nr:MAG: hypothetical protein B7Z26_11215 [Asticcacaulis sp. 32-58-5]